MAAAGPRRGGEWTRQDGQIVPCPQHGGRSHAQYRWDERVARLEPELVGYPVRVAWREAEPKHRDSNTGAVHRRHDVGMILVSRWGFLHTCYIAPDVEVPDDE